MTRGYLPSNRHPGPQAAAVELPERVTVGNDLFRRLTVLEAEVMVLKSIVKRLGGKNG